MCTLFVRSPLNETLSADGVAKHVDFDMIPWGNAYYNTTECGSASGYDKQHSMFCWVRTCGVSTPAADCFDRSVSPILCQHGPDECFANTLEGCALHIYGGTTNPAVLDFVYCYEGVNDGQRNAAQHCAESAGLDFTQLSKCANSDLGAQVQVTNAKRTIALGVAKLGTPWVLVDGQVLDDPSQLLDKVCEAIPDGERPRGCSEESRLAVRRRIQNSGPPKGILLERD